MFKTLQSSQEVVLATLRIFGPGTFLQDPGGPGGVSGYLVAPLGQSMVLGWFQSGPGGAGSLITSEAL